MGNKKNPAETVAIKAIHFSEKDVDGRMFPLLGDFPRSPNIDMGLPKHRMNVGSSSFNISTGRESGPAVFQFGLARNIPVISSMAGPSRIDSANGGCGNRLMMMGLSLCDFVLRDVLTTPPIVHEFAPCPVPTYHPRP